jgi:hypothetical protein
MSILKKIKENKKVVIAGVCMIIGGVILKKAYNGNTEIEDTNEFDDIIDVPELEQTIIVEGPENDIREENVSYNEINKKEKDDEDDGKN